MDAREVPPRLVRSDAWLLAALTERPQRRALTLPELLHDADWLNRAIPTLDELSFGLPRLIAAGFVVVTGAGNDLRLQPTSKAREFGKSIRRKARRLGDVLEAAESLAGAPPYPVPEDEDRSLNRLPALAEADVNEAVRAYEAWFGLRARPFIAASRVLRRVIGRR